MMSKKQAKLSSYWTERPDPEDDDDDVICLSSTISQNKTLKNKNKKSFHGSLTQVPSTSVQKKVSNSWVTSSFDDFLDFDSPLSKSVGVDNNFNVDTSVKRGVKRLRETLSTVERSRKPGRLRQADDTLWADKHKPGSQTDLAVHKKKIQEVEGWLHMTQKKQSHSQRAPILLLTGPTGAGKTATIQVLAKESNIEVQDWTNPVVTGTYRPMSNEEFRQNLADFSSMGGHTSQSQVQIFEDFLLRANKYPTLQIFGEDTYERKLIVVEDYPNIFFKDSAAFHNILRKYVRTGRSPLVFIVGESASGESHERLLFPKDLQAELGIENISYNPVAPTMMIKILSRVANQESSYGAKSFPLPDRSTLEALSASSNGDIRGAINALQFACLKDTRDLTKTFSKKSQSNQGKKSKSSSSKRKSDSKDNALSAIGGKDTSLFLFRALGKILYCKREDTDSPETPKLPDHLVEHERNALAFNPEDVVDRCHLSSDMFNAYLHQNFLDFSTSIEDVTRASEYLSLADSITSDWAVRSVMNDYSSCIATRGLLHSNRGRPPGGSGGGGWRPLHKPQWFSVMKQMREKIATAKVLFKGYHWTPEVLQTQLIPYLGLVNVTMHDPSQITFLQDITKFRGHNHLTSSTARLDEKDVASLQIDEDPYMQGESADAIPNSQSNKSQPEDDDEIEIEDFDSD